MLGPELEKWPFGAENPQHLLPLPDNSKEQFVISRFAPLIVAAPSAHFNRDECHFLENEIALIGDASLSRECNLCPSCNTNL